MGDPRAVDVGRGIHAARLSHPSDDSATRASRQQESTGWSAWLALVRQNWRFLACVCLLRGHMRPITVLAPFTGEAAGYSASAVGYLWSLGVVAEVIIFALSNKLFRRCSARDMLLISAICGVVRWGIM
ncbi:MFS transporter [Escherichia coli]